MTINWELIIVTVVSSLVGGGLISGLATFFRARSGAADDITKAAERMVEQYRKQVDELTCKLTLMEQRINALEEIARMLDDVIAGAHRLVHQVQALGGVPVYVPPERRDEVAQSKRKKKDKANDKENQ